MQTKSKNICVCNTKGGVGKSIISKFILPIILDENATINLYELDSSNSQGNLKSDKLNYKLARKVDTEEGEKILFDIVFSNQDDSSIYNIIDSGAGQDTRNVLKGLKEAGVDDIEFFIPTNKDDEQSHNVEQTIKLIKELYDNPLITLVFNYADPAKELQDDFVNFFGKKEWGLEPSIVNIIEDVDNMISIPRSDIFLVLKNRFKMPLIDFYPIAKDFVDNEKEWQKRLYEESKGDKEVFYNSLSKIKFSKYVVRYVDKIREEFDENYASDKEKKEEQTHTENSEAKDNNSDWSL